MHSPSWASAEFRGAREAPAGSGAEAAGWARGHPWRWAHAGVQRPLAVGAGDPGHGRAGAGESGGLGGAVAEGCRRESVCHGCTLRRGEAKPPGSWAQNPLLLPGKDPRNRASLVLFKATCVGAVGFGSFQFFV